MKLNVLYEDNHLIAVYKPAGVLTQRDKTGDISLIDEVKAYLKEKYQKSGNVFLGLLHRLDRPVSGIVLFAKTSKGASRLSEQFRNHQIEKTYNAIVMGKMNYPVPKGRDIPAGEFFRQMYPRRRGARYLCSEIKKNKGTLINYIQKDRNKKRATIGKKRDSKKAELSYKVLASNDKFSLLEIKIKTGRFHQIRAQLSSIGHSILGDIKYDAPFALPDKSIALSATSISFQTATSKEKKEISVRIPSQWDSVLKYLKQPRFIRP